MMLSGQGFGDTVEWDFYCTGGRNAGQWGKIGVPSQWELEGYGEYTYGRWYKKKGGQPSREEGIYRRTFDVPREWKGRRVSIVFDGVMTDTEVRINGKLAGEVHRGGFYRFQYDVSGKLNYGGKNEVEVKVSKHSANKSVNAAERKADWWLFGGIYRPVWLEALPSASIGHFAVDARHNGDFLAEVELNNAKAGNRLVASIRPLTGDRVTFPECSMPLAKGTTGKATFRCHWDGVKAWNPEDPNLYILTLRLEDARGKVLHVTEDRIGFRTVEFKRHDGIYVNGVKILMKGINRHSFWPDGGRCTNRDISLMDALLIKEMNMNAIRSHYPPDEHFLDMCDSLGFFVIDELAGWQNAYDTETGRKLQREMLMRDVNHPCIIIWSNGNEGGWNTALDARFADYDPQKRHVIHPWADFDGLDTHHYPAYLTGVARFTNGYNVFMPAEFMHGCYDQGHGAGLEDFWNKYKAHPLCAGGFMWDFSDNAVKRTDRNGALDSDGELGADGILGPYREKEGSYYTVREVWAPIQFRPLYITSSFKGDFYISNEYLYTNLDRCRMEYRLLQVASPLAGGQQQVVGKGTVSVPALEPGETGRMHMELPDNFFRADVLELTAYDKSGKSVCTWTWPIKYAAEYAHTALPRQNNRSLSTAQETDTQVVLSANGVEVVFDKTTGMLTGVRNAGGTVSFGNGPVPVGMKVKFKDAAVRREGGDAIFTVRYLGAIDSIQWRMTPDGLLRMDAVMLNRASGGGGFDDAFVDDNIINFGISFDYPEELVNGMTWFGRGPYRVWKNRIKGTNYGVWSKAYNNTMTGASFDSLVYPEFKGYHANMYWATLQNKESDFTLLSESDGLYLRVYTPAQPEATKDRDLPPFPTGDISFLYDIPGMRCFKPLHQHGPSAQPGNIRIKKGDEGIRMKVWFDFRKVNAPDGR